MPWYETVLILAGVTLSLIILIRPHTDGRRMAFTLLVGALVLLTIGLAMKELTDAVSVAPGLPTSAVSHSQDALGDGGSTPTPIISSHRRRPVPMAAMDPGLRREDKTVDIMVNLPTHSEH